MYSLETVLVAFVLGMPAGLILYDVVRDVVGIVVSLMRND